MSNEQRYNFTMYSPLATLAPLLRYSLASDDFGNFVIVSSAAWLSAHYFANN